MSIEAASKLFQAGRQYVPIVVRAAESKIAPKWPSFQIMSYLKNEYGFNEKSMARSIPETFAHPRLIRNALQTEKTMHQKNLFPCVHAQPAPFTVPMAVHNATSNTPTFFKRLRGPEKQYDNSADRMMDLATSKLKKSQSGDIGDSELASMMSACNYSVLGNNVTGESVLWWALKAKHNNGKSLPDVRRMLEGILRANGIAESDVKQLMIEAEPILQGYAALKVSNLHVIGIPKPLLGRVAYDSKMKAFPSGKDITQYSKAVPWSGNGDYSQLRVIMSKETLNPEYGLKIVTANNPSEVGEFCEGTSNSPAEESFMDTWAKPADTAEETLEAQKRKELDEQTKAFVKKVIRAKAQLQKTNNLQTFY